MIKSILFDLDGTIINEDQIKEGLAFVYKNNSILNSNLRYDNFLEVNLRCRKLLEIKHQSGEVKFHQSGYLIWELLLQEIGKPPLASHVNKLYEDLQSFILNHINIRDGFMNLLTYTKDNSIITGVISNGSITERVNRLRKVNLLDKIDFLISSDIVGYEKPSKEIFNYALNLLKISSSEVIYVGNNVTTDIDGPSSVGIRPFLVINQKEVFPTQNNIDTITSFDQLIPIIKRLNS